MIRHPGIIAATIVVAATFLLANEALAQVQDGSEADRSRCLGVSRIMARELAGQQFAITIMRQKSPLPRAQALRLARLEKAYAEDTALFLQLRERYAAAPRLDDEAMRVLADTPYEGIRLQALTCAPAPVASLQTAEAPRTPVNLPPQTR